MPTHFQRLGPVGPQVTANGVHLRVWAPEHQSVEVVYDGSPGASTALSEEGNGYFSGLTPGAAAGALYRFRIDGKPDLFPDPVSHFQPSGPHGPSQVIDPAFDWTDAEWKGVPAAGQVLYELHVGTFTKAGTWASAIEQLGSLKDVGVTCIEVMPVNEFAGERNWGYDGVSQFAPFHGYGTPEDFCLFVDAAHATGLGVILDLVYNHFGPDGNYVNRFSDYYLNAEHHTDWGDAINFDGPNSKPVREFFITNACYWITQFHLDGFRFDATQAFVDTSPRHILAEINEAVRAAAPGKMLYLINENEPQDSKLFRSVDCGGYGLDANWNDDFHHAAMCALTGHNEAYYADHPGTPQEFISGAKYGYLFQGQRYTWQSKRRGTPSLDAPPTAFVHFLQNHDQIANSARGLRVHQLTSPGQFRAMTALLLLAPQTPMLFQGQEWAASSPFLFFSDHHDGLQPLIKKGRARELSQFASIATPTMQAALRDPSAIETFEDSKLDHNEKAKPGHAEAYALHRDLLALRRSESTFRRVQGRGDVDGAVLGPDAFLLRHFDDSGDDRLLLINLGRDLPLDPAPEPLLAPPAGMRWAVQLSTEDPKYGGSGSPHPDTEEEGWFLLGRSAVLLRPLQASEATVQTRKLGRGSAQAPFKKSELKDRT
ncbi:MAG: treZ 3 [Phycisphaerales bacterium]|nr:treZ 3 [Phycisphaerales bacterium]